MVQREEWVWIHQQVSNDLLFSALPFFFISLFFFNIHYNIFFLTEIFLSYLAFNGKLIFEIHKHFIFVLVLL